MTAEGRQGGCCFIEHVEDRATGTCCALACTTWSIFFPVGRSALHARISIRWIFGAMPLKSSSVICATLLLA